MILGKLKFDGPSCTHWVPPLEMLVLHCCQVLLFLMFLGHQLLLCISSHLVSAGCLGHDVGDNLSLVIHNIFDFANFGRVLLAVILLCLVLCLVMD